MKKRTPTLSLRVLCGCSVHGTRNERDGVCHERVGVLFFSGISGSVWGSPRRLQVPYVIPRLGSTPTYIHIFPYKRIFHSYFLYLKCICNVSMCWFIGEAYQVGSLRDFPSENLKFLQLFFKCLDYGWDIASSLANIFLAENNGQKIFISWKSCYKIAYPNFVSPKIEARNTLIQHKDDQPIKYFPFHWHTLYGAVACRLKYYCPYTRRINIIQSRLLLYCLHNHKYEGYISKYQTIQALQFI